MPIRRQTARFGRLLCGNFRFPAVGQILGKITLADRSTLDIGKGRGSLLSCSTPPDAEDPLAGLSFPV